VLEQLEIDKNLLKVTKLSDFDWDKKTDDWGHEVKFWKMGETELSNGDKVVYKNQNGYFCLHFLKR
jgi:hypothetical protein